MSRLRAAAAMRDEDIDLTDPDAPEATDLSGGVRGKFFRPAMLRPAGVQPDVQNDGPPTPAET